MRKAAVLGAALWACAVGSVGGQQVEAGITHSSYSMTDGAGVWLDDVRLTHAPLAARYALGGRYGISLESGFAEATVRLPSGASATVSGVTDATLSGAAHLGPVAATIALVLPTGETVRTLEEATVVGLLSSDLFPVGLTQWGTGGGAALELSHGRRWGNVDVVFTAAYAAFRESESLEPGAVAYRPASQLRGGAALQAAVGEAGVVALFAGVQHYGSDTYDSDNLFTPGLRAEAEVAYTFPFGGRESARVYLGAYSMGAGAIERPLDSAPAVENLLAGATTPRARRVLQGGFELHWVRGPLAVAPLGDLRIVRSPSGTSQGWVASVGARAAYHASTLARGVVIEPHLAVRTGRVVVSADRDSGMRGWEAGLTVRWEAGP